MSSYVCFKEAKEHIKKSVSLWLPDAKVLVEDSDAAEVETPQGTEVADPLDCLPISAEAQLKAAKTLIEVEEYNVSSVGGV